MSSTQDGRLPASDWLHEVGAHLARWLVHLRRSPVYVAFSLLQPFFWLFFFSYGMRGALAASPYPGLSDYPAFIAASVLVMTVFNNSLAGGIALLFDRENGTLDRILVAPISRSGIVVGRFLAVSIVSVLQCAVILGLSAALGVRVATGPLGGVVIVLLALLFGLGITALSLALAFVFHNHAEFFGVLGFVSLPLIFASSALVPLEALPGWLRAMALANPMTYCIDGVRALVQTGWDAPFLARMAGALAAFDLAALGLSTWVISRRMG